MSPHLSQIIFLNSSLFTQEMQEVDKTKSIPMTVKDLDHIVYDMYRELYGLRDIRSSNYNLNNFTADDKKGHCC